MNAHNEQQAAVEMARQFHETYERLAPSFGYETRPETRQFDPSSPNGRLMIAVCSVLAESPVVKQNLTTPPAAAQEAAYQVRRGIGEPWKECDRAAFDVVTASRPADARKLYAAPVTAAPAVAYMVDGRVERGLTFDKAAADTMAFANGGTVRPLGFVGGTPAAPGIDPSKLQRYRMASDADDARNLYKDDTGTWVKIQDVERALIDASPKGGSEALDALRVAYRHLDVESLRVSHCNDLAIIHAAMQAGDSEVQP